MWGLCPGKDVGMSISEAVTKRRRRSFSPEFKAEIVALCQLPDNTVASVCKEYDLARDGGAPLGPPGRGRCRREAGRDDRLKPRRSPGCASSCGR